MNALVYYGLMAAALLWRLPHVRKEGQRRLTAVWLLLWLAGIGLGVIWFWFPETWRLAEAVTN